MELPFKDIAHHAEKLVDQPQDGLVKSQKHGNQGAQVQEDGEEGPRFPALAGEILDQREVAGTGDWQKLGQTLDNALKKRVQDVHEEPPYVSRP